MYVLMHERVHWFGVISDSMALIASNEIPIHHRYNVLLYKFASLQSGTLATQQLVVVQENTRAWVCNEQHIEAYAMSKPRLHMPCHHPWIPNTTLLNRKKSMVCSSHKLINNI